MSLPSIPKFFIPYPTVRHGQITDYSIDFTLSSLPTLDGIDNIAIFKTRFEPPLEPFEVETSERMPDIFYVNDGITPKLPSKKPEPKKEEPAKKKEEPKAEPSYPKIEEVENEPPQEKIVEKPTNRVLVREKIVEVPSAQQAAHPKPAVKQIKGINLAMFNCLPMGQPLPPGQLKKMLNKNKDDHAVPEDDKLEVIDVSFEPDAIQRRRGPRRRNAQ